MAIDMQPAQAGFAVVAAISNRRTRHFSEERVVEGNVLGHPPEKLIFREVCHCEARQGRGNLPHWRWRLLDQKEGHTVASLAMTRLI